MELKVGHQMLGLKLGLTCFHLLLAVVAGMLVHGGSAD